VEDPVVPFQRDLRKVGRCGPFAAEKIVAMFGATFVVECLIQITHASEMNAKERKCEEMSGNKQAVSSALNA
jgi:hypothetical protein